MYTSPFQTRGDILSWGRVVRDQQRVAEPRFRSELPALLSDGEQISHLACGLRRSYGDSCLNSAGRLIDVSGLDRFIEFDGENGILRAEAGLSLSQALAFIVPKGWFLPTTPGTRFVTLGGAVANDIHGKNHHRAGTMGCHVRAIGLLRSDGRRSTVSALENAELFAATIGGLGLTGVIEWVELDLVRIASSNLEVEIVPYETLDAFWTLAAESTERFEHTVAWVDSTARGRRLGRGIFARANWATDGKREVHIDRTWKRLPVDLPAILLNRLTVGAFNEIYYRVNLKKSGTRRQHYGAFFYPLDTIHQWNRLYGRSGMLQYQCVIPPGPDRPAIAAMLGEIARSGHASFLSVLKTFGPMRSPGMLSFPREGTTLALDFPNRGSATLTILERLDVILAEAGGALYPAKDGRMSGDLFRASFPQLEAFRRHKDPGMESDFWRRVME